MGLDNDDDDICADVANHYMSVSDISDRNV